MFNKSILEKVLAQYKQDFVLNQWKNENYKWKAVKQFQDNWDVNASDFSEMLSRSLEKTYNLLASANNFPKGMMSEFAKAAPEEVRAMFIALFDESRDVFERMDEFKHQSSVLLEKYGNGAAQHYQYENAISTYLWLRYPDKYYIYKFSEVKTVASELESDYQFRKGAYAENIRNFLNLYDEISAALKEDAELVNLLHSHLTDDCYPDPELKTLTIDVGFYISRVFLQKNIDAPTRPSLNYAVPSVEEANLPLRDDEKCNYWWLNANPKIWSFSDIAVGETQAYTLYNENGNKRRIFQNFLDAKVGDVVIGYESNPVRQIVAIGRVSAEQDGEKLFFEKVETLSSPIDYAVLKECPELENMEYFRNPQGSLFKLTRSEYEFILDMIREENPIVTASSSDAYTKDDFLNEVYMTEERYETLVNVLRNKKNIILQGAPGVGKTFAARRLAWSMMGEKDDSRIEFVQFHQNYSYEDFMMGYKPVEDGFELKYGIFYRFCQKAANQPDKEFFFIIDEINRGNMSKIFGELLMLIEKDYRGTKMTLAYNGLPFSVPKNLYIIGMMNTADRSLAMIDYALRRRFSFFEIEPGFDSQGFISYQNGLNSETLDELISKVKELNRKIAADKSLGRGFCIGHSYFCGRDVCTDEWLHSVVDYDILPMLSEYWFDDENEFQRWKNVLQGVFQ
ncbi:gTPase subunit of restriction endonuclease [Ruminococcus sp. CAG:177]|nr:gTPase subunit of restriction endonuclease [Ruminococcus sp. CAG:177]